MRERIREGFAEMDRLRDAIDRECGVVVLGAEEAEQPGAAWDAFVTLVSYLEHEELKPEQRPAALAYWYDAEVCNGGHYQYFVNLAGQRAREAVTALEAIGSSEGSALLEQAIAIWESRERERPETLEAFVEGAREDEFGELDERFYELEPSLGDLLQRYVEAHRADFVAVADESGERR